MERNHSLSYPRGLMFRGIWSAVIDAYCRFKVPPDFVKILKVDGPNAAPLVIVGGNECLHFLPPNNLESFENEPIWSERYPTVLGMVQLDDHGKIRLDQKLLSYISSGTGQEVTIDGQLDNFAVWSTERFLMMIRKIPFGPEDEIDLDKFGV